MDEKLVLMAKKRDKDAFVSLIDKQRMSMYKIGRAILKDDEDIADAIQDTILTAWEKIDTLKKPRYFRTWFTRILINHCNAIYHKKSKILPYEKIAVLEKSEERDAYEGVEWEEMLRTLNEKQRIVVELNYAEQFKVKEIAEILHIGQSAVKGRLQAARKHLENYYPGY